jgi:hypothetical protein
VIKLPTAQHDYQPGRRRYLDLLSQVRGSSEVEIAEVAAREQRRRPGTYRNGPAQFVRSKEIQQSLAGEARVPLGLAEASHNPCWQSLEFYRDLTESVTSSFRTILT